MITESNGALIYPSTAVFSDDKRYRYHLTRRWDDGPAVAFCMLNPSTADAFELDPTVRRCIQFAKRDGYGALIVVNLFALRSTDPKALRAADDPVGPENNGMLVEVFAGTTRVIAACGTHGKLNGRADAVLRLAEASRNKGLRCLGTTKDGHPRHPLYVKGDKPVEWFRAAEEAAA